MIPRHGRLLSLSALVLALASPASGAVFPQGESAPAAPERVKKFAEAVRDVARIGGTTTPLLATMAKSESTATATLVNWIGQSIKDKAPPPGLDTAPASIEPQVKVLVTAARDLLGLRDRGLEPLAAAIADSGNADVKPYLEKAETRVYVALCATAIRGYLGPNGRASGTFDGMFASLEKFNRDRVGDAFLDLLSATGQQQGVRELAGEGLAQLGTQRHLEALRALVNDPNQKALHVRVMYTMARLGDRKLIDAQLARIDAEMEKLKKPEMTAQETRRWAEGFRQKALIAQTIHDTDAAIKHYLEFLAAIDPIREKLGASVAGDDQNSFYNLACLYSLKADVESGFKYLEKAFAAGYDNYKWANTDGDLTNLRKDPRFKAMVEKWESGKGAAEKAPASKPT